MSMSNAGEMRELHDRVREDLGKLAQLAHQQAANQNNEAAVRFRNHRMRDLYREAETSEDSAAALLEPEAAST